MTKFVSSDFVKPETIEEREFQLSLAERIVRKGNSLVVAPTALGKTVIAALVTAKLMEEENKNHKFVLLAPTKPLVEQHLHSMQKFLNLNENDFIEITGEIKAKDRKQLWSEKKVIVSTPQCIENDLANNLIDLKDVKLMVFDECHKAVQNYSYVFIARQLMKEKNNGIILGLTASPGSEQEKINEVCENLFIKNIEIKTLEDEDVKEFVNEIKVEWKLIDLPEGFLKVKNCLDSFMNEMVVSLRRTGFGSRIAKNFIRKNELIALQSALRKKIGTHGKQHPTMFQAISLIAAMLKVSHARILLETQGVQALQEYFDKMINESGKTTAPKALKTILRNKNIIESISLTRQLNQKQVLHPKQVELKTLLLEQFELKPESKVLVFNHYRATASKLEKFLNESSLIKAKRFVGQASKENDVGMNQKTQVKTIKDFKSGKYNVLLATSVAEEGIDLPEVELVVFFEAVPSEIRLIQRRGRTGRIKAGRVIILLARNTLDETYYWASMKKEKKMHSTLKKLKQSKEIESELEAEEKEEENIEEIKENKIKSNRKLETQTTLREFNKKKVDEIIVHADQRERNSRVIRELIDLKVEVIIKQLELGDYILSKDVAVERKTIQDFLSSLIDGRLFKQLNDLSLNYEKPLLLVEGDFKEIYSLRNVHENAIIGALTSIALNYRVPVLFTSNDKETAKFLYVIAKREQSGKENELRLRIGRKGLTDKQLQQFIVESLPLVGPQLARNLLKKFKSIKNIVNAKSSELKEVENLGPKKTKEIKRIINKEYC
ncbi:MAG: DEAD/DEAH box helicase [archaeon]